MRLSELETKNIIRGLLECPQSPLQFELYLFGSRADDTKKGGDIDLLLLLEDSQYDQTIAVKHYLMAYLKKYLDDQRLDLTIVAKSKLPIDPFFQSIKDEIVILFKK